MTSTLAFAVDLDGTLVDTSTANTEAYRSALAEHGVQAGPEAIAPLAGGRHWTDVLPKILVGTGVDPAAVAATKRRIYPDYLGSVRVNDMLVTVLRALRSLGSPSALVTTASASASAAVLESCGLEDLFDLRVTGDDVDRHKPHPEPYLAAIERLRVPAGRVLAVEDSPAGAASARAAGLQVWLVEWHRPV